MQIVKPLWLKHAGERKDAEVYSCHVSSDGLRLVTAAGDGYVRVWSTDAIYNGTNVDYTEPKQLASLSYHSGTIHTVRFSNSNKYIASGADDKIVCVYHLDPTPPTHTTFGSNEAPPVENWRILRRLIGHENDVQDLGWSYDASILVSVGLDSRVVVWSGHTFEKLKTLSNHGSHVKGITFDPANKYFATASDDRTIKIFRYTSPAPNSTAYDQTNNFMIEATITTPFLTSPLTTYFRRCSWSPDGIHIAAANAVNGPISTAAVINRGTWDSDISLIGHEAPVEVCSFSPRIFSKTPHEQLDPNEVKGPKGVTVIACAGQDHSLSIWNTVNSKPLVVSEGVALKSISDLAWAPDGERLFVTSLDGTIALVKFGTGELGFPVPLEYNETSLAKYGAGRKVGVVEGPDALLLEEMSKSDELKNVQGRMGELMGDLATSKTNGVGKLTTINGVDNAVSSRAPDKDTPRLTNGHTPAQDTSRGQTPQPTKEDPNAARVDRLKQRVTITKDGKKRVAPLLLSSAAGVTESSLPTSQLMSLNSQIQRNDAPQSILDLSKPYDGLPAGGLSSLLLGNRRRFAESGAEDDSVLRHRAQAAERQGATSIMANTPDGLTTATSALTHPDQASTHAILNPALMLSQTRLATPTVRTHIVRSLGDEVKSLKNGEQGHASSQVAETHVFDVRNPTGPSRSGRSSERDPARITVTKKGQMLWQDFLPKSVSLVTGNSRFWAASCEDGSVFVWTPAGRRLFNAFALEAQAVILDCRGPWLLAISAIGLCHVWNVITTSSPHPPISLAPVLDMASQSQGPHLTVGPSIIFARLNSEGRLVVAMSNGDAFTYSHALYTWQRLSEAWWAVGSQYWNSSESAGRLQQANKATDDDEDDEVRIENISAGVIPLLERHTTSHTLLRGRAFHLQRLIKALLSAEGYEGLESAVSVAHLENRLAAALTLGGREEFKVYLGMYAKRLGAEGSRLKIEELLRSLLAGIYADHEETTLHDSTKAYMGGPSDELCGWKKETLLKEVVVILGKYRDLQRTTLPYARLLGITSMEDGDTEMVS